MSTDKIIIDNGIFIGTGFVNKMMSTGEVMRNGKQIAVSVEVVIFFNNSEQIVEARKIFQAGTLPGTLLRPSDRESPN